MESYGTPEQKHPHKGNHPNAYTNGKSNITTRRKETEKRNSSEKRNGPDIHPDNSIGRITQRHNPRIGHQN